MPYSPKGNPISTNIGYNFIVNVFWIIVLAIVTGQLIKLPLGNGGPILLDIVVGLLCLLGILKLRFKLQKPPLHIKAGLIFILVALISLILTPLNLSTTEYLTSFLYAARFFSYIFLGWLIYSGTFKFNQKVLSISGIILAVLGLIQLIFLPDLRFLTAFGWDPHYFRTASTFLDPNFLGAFLVLTLILLVPKKLLFFIVYVALLTTFSRGAYLAFLTSFLILSFLNKSVRLAIITCLLFLGLMIGFFSYQRLVAEPRGIDRVTSAQFRLNTWTQGWQLIQQYPVFGVGFNTYKYALKQYNLGDQQFLQSHGASTNDSSLLYVGVTTGVLGFSAFIFFLVSLFMNGNLLLRAGLLGLIAQSFFANTLFYPPLLLWLILISLIHKK